MTSETKTTSKIAAVGILISIVVICAAVILIPSPHYTRDDGWSDAELIGLNHGYFAGAKDGAVGANFTGFFPRQSEAYGRGYYEGYQASSHLSDEELDKLKEVGKRAYDAEIDKLCEELMEEKENV